MESQAPHLQQRPRKVNSTDFTIKDYPLLDYLKYSLNKIKAIGYTPSLEEYEQRKLSIFNQLNFFLLIINVCIPIVGIITIPGIPFNVWAISFLPATISLAVLYLNKILRHEAALYLFFIAYPFVTCVVYMSGMDAGIGLTFILCGILSVFFLKEPGSIVFSLAFSMISYFILIVVLEQYKFNFQLLNSNLYLSNHLLLLAFIFYGLYLIKNENILYHQNILVKNKALEEKNGQISKQAQVLQSNTVTLRKQAEELAELNSIKNKVFSVISHDLKAPMYALRNLFREVHQDNMPAEDLKKLVPGVLNDINFTTSLMENLLQWSKSQMKAGNPLPEKISIKNAINEVTQLLHLQAKPKNVTLHVDSKEEATGRIDKETLHLVLRNLISNAIKFSPENETVSIGITRHDSFIEVYVKDQGIGISSSDLKKISRNDFFTTKGTANESGTGLGLMLCKEFLAKNGGQLYIESKEGVGSTFSFTIPAEAPGEVNYLSLPKRMPSH